MDRGTSYLHFDPVEVQQFQDFFRPGPSSVLPKATWALKAGGGTGRAGAVALANCGQAAVKLAPPRMSDDFKNVRRSDPWLLPPFQTVMVSQQCTGSPKADTPLVK